MISTENREALEERRARADRRKYMRRLRRGTEEGLNPTAGLCAMGPGHKKDGERAEPIFTKSSRG